ncbi:MAG: hypothetical protein WA477_06390 [Candidatus Sulfotelmatobacter sp.]
MSFKLLQFSPLESTRAIRMKDIPERWTEGYEYSRGVRFLPAWLEDDTDFAEGTGRHIKWAAISGLALSVAISGGFWVGLGLLIARLVR